MMGTATMAPERSYDQRLAALRQANGIRTARARLKHDAKAGRADLLSVIADPPAFVETMKIFDLLVAMPRVGRVTATRVLKRAAVSPSKTIGGLTERQRRELAGMMRRRAS